MRECMMTEQERIASIKKNGGCHLKNFKIENITYEMCLAAVNGDGNALIYVPEQFCTEEIFKIACMKTGMMLSEVPDDKRTLELCKEAVKSDGMAIQFIPEKYQTEEICLLAVANDVRAFQKIPEELITTSFVIEVIRQSTAEAICSLPKQFKKTVFYQGIVEYIPEVIWYLPQNMHTATICKSTLNAMKYVKTVDAIKDNPEMLSQLHVSLYDHDSCLAFVTSEFFGNIIDKHSCGFISDGDFEKGLLYLNKEIDKKYSLPHILRWADVCDVVLRLRPDLIRYVKESVLTEALCLLAVGINGNVLMYIPENMRTQVICGAAFENDKWSIAHIPTEFITNEMVIDAVRESGFILQYIPNNLKSYEACKIALQDNCRGLSYLPERIWDKALALIAIANDNWGMVLDKIPEELRDYEVCFNAVSKRGDEIRYVPEQLKTYELCLAAVKKSYGIVEDIPYEHFLPELVMEIVKKSIRDFEKIPKECLTEEACIMAIKQGTKYVGTVLEKIPEEMITKEMVDIAMDISLSSFNGVPERFISEEMVLDLAKNAPGHLASNFPNKFRNNEFFEKLQEYPTVLRLLGKNNI